MNRLPKRGGVVSVRPFRHLLVIVPLLGGSFLWAESRSSLSYALGIEALDSGGRRSIGGTYTHDGSLGSMGTPVIATGGPIAVKAGMWGQVSERVGLSVTAGSGQLAESQSLQLTASAILDDETLVLLDPTSVEWSSIGEPVVSITPGGLVTASPVYANTPVTIQGTTQSASDTIVLSIMDAASDNFGSYAGDGLDDDWQVQYFGLNHPEAGPDAVSDASGLTNRFKFLAGLVPGSAGSTFDVRIGAPAGNPSQTELRFRPLVSGRTYTVEFTDTLQSGDWQPLTTFTQNDESGERIVVDQENTGPRRFYRVKIAKP